MTQIRVVLADGKGCPAGDAIHNSARALSKLLSRQRRLLRLRKPCLLFALLGALLIPARPGPAWEFDPTQAQNVDLCGQVGGSCRAVAFQGAEVLIGQGPRLVKVDVSDPSHPVERASFVFPAMVGDIAVRGNVACVLAGGLWFLDVGAPDALRELGHLAVTGTKVYTSGSLALVLNRAPGLQLVDFRHPDQPLLIGNLELSRPDSATVPTGLTLRGPIAYLSYSRRSFNPGIPVVGGIMILDLAEPKVPWIVFDLFEPGPFATIARDRDLLCVAIEQWIGFFDITSVFDPRLVGWVPGPRAPRELAILNSRLHALGAGAIWVYELNGLNLPSELFRAAIPGQGIEFKVRGNQVCVADGRAGLTVMEQVTSRSLQPVGSLTALSSANGVAVLGDYAYVADGDAGVRIYDLRDAGHPREIGRYPTANPAMDIQVHDTQAFVAEVTLLEILDLTRPDHPVHLSSVPLSGEVYDVRVFGGYAYVANGTEGLVIVGVNDPAHPVVLGQSRAPGFALSVAPAGGFAYVCDQSGLLGVVELDVRNPRLPSATAQLGTEGAPAYAAFNGRYIAVAESDRGVRVAGRDSRGRFQTLGRLELTGLFRGLAYSEHLVFAADAQFGLRVISTFDPVRLSQTGFLATAGLPTRVALGKGLIYLAAGEGGLYALRYRGAPDLAIREFDFSPQIVVAGTELHLTGTIVNNNTTPTATGAWVKVYAYETPAFNDERWLLCPPLRLPAQLTNRTPLDLAAHRFVANILPKGKYYLALEVDGDNEVAEFREDNNLQPIVTKRLYYGPGKLAARHWTLYK